MFVALFWAILEQSDIRYERYVLNQYYRRKTGNQQAQNNLIKNCTIRPKIIVTRGGSDLGAMNRYLKKPGRLSPSWLYLDSSLLVEESRDIRVVHVVAGDDA